MITFSREYFSIQKGYCHFLEHWFISTKISRSERPMWAQGLNLPATFILEPLIGHRRLTVKKSATTSRSLSLSALSITPGIVTRRVQVHHIPGGVSGSLSKQRDVVGKGDLDPAQQRSTGSGIQEKDRGHQTVERESGRASMVAWRSGDGGGISPPAASRRRRSKTALLALSRRQIKCVS